MPCIASSRDCAPVLKVRAVPPSTVAICRCRPFKLCKAKTRQNDAVLLAPPTRSLFQAKKRLSTPLNCSSTLQVTMSPYIAAIKSPSRSRTFLRSCRLRNGQKDSNSMSELPPSSTFCTTLARLPPRVLDASKIQNDVFQRRFITLLLPQHLALRTTMSPYFDAIKSPSRPRSLLRSRGAESCFPHCQNRRKCSNLKFELPANWGFRTTLPRFPLYIHLHSQRRSSPPRSQDGIFRRRFIGTTAPLSCIPPGHNISSMRRHLRPSNIVNPHAATRAFSTERDGLVRGRSALLPFPAPCMSPRNSQMFQLDIWASRDLGFLYDASPGPSPPPFAFAAPFEPKKSRNCIFRLRFIGIAAPPSPRAQAAISAPTCAQMHLTSAVSPYVVSLPFLVCSTERDGLVRGRSALLPLPTRCALPTTIQTRYSDFPQLDSCSQHRSHAMDVFCTPSSRNSKFRRRFVAVTMPHCLQDNPPAVHFACASSRLEIQCFDAMLLAVQTRNTLPPNPRPSTCSTTMYQHRFIGW